MRPDRYTKLVLTVIAVALCVIALPRLETPEVMAETRQPEAAQADGPQQRVSPPRDHAAPASQGPRAPTSTLPLRWRVAWAALETGSWDTFCSTAVIVTNTTAADINVEVEWMTSSFSMALRPNSVPAFAHRIWTPSTSIQVNPVPWFSNDFPGLSDFDGYALVTADDPRIMVSAFQFCRSGTGTSGPTVLSQTNIPAYPVGATAEYFQAGMPVDWTPPMAEVPE